MKNALYVLRSPLGLKQCQTVKIKPLALADIKLQLSEGIKFSHADNYTVNQSLENFIKYIIKLCSTLLKALKSISRLAWAYQPHSSRKTEAGFWVKHFPWATPTPFAVPVLSSI